MIELPNLPPYRAFSSYERQTPTIPLRNTCLNVLRFENRPMKLDPQ